MNPTNDFSLFFITVMYYPVAGGKLTRAEAVLMQIFHYLVQ